MISPQVESALKGEGPLTHRAYTAAACRRFLAGQVEPVRVQIRKQGTVSCGCIAKMHETFTNSGEFFQVDTQLFGLVWVESRNIRLCSGLGCTCEPVSEVQA